MLFHGDGAGRDHAVAKATEVWRDHQMGGRKMVDLGFPHRMVEGKAVDQQQRVSRASLDDLEHVTLNRHRQHGGGTSEGGYRAIAARAAGKRADPAGG